MHRGCRKAALGWKAALGLAGSAEPVSAAAHRGGAEGCHLRDTGAPPRGGQRSAAQVQQGGGVGGCAVCTEVLAGPVSAARCVRCLMRPPHSHARCCTATVHHARHGGCHGSLMRTDPVHTRRAVSGLCSASHLVTIVFYRMSRSPASGRDGELVGRCLGDIAGVVGAAVPHSPRAR
jgi:hypothetical protein